ncbi:MAG: ABC transporter ATP-binding protein [Opitutales bacterium]|jgi:ABC-2 type transport system ATP-binding protein|tara:strand:- start:4427 stop:5440 length:1014 start_codon:yes stop_codon:yes gene_type:complete
MSAENKPLPIIEVINLKKKYGRIHALKGISFSIGKGEIVGFLGPNGAGKSTTLRILSGLIPADSGEAKVCGVDLAEEEGQVRNHIGYLAENNPLPEELRVIEYLHFRALLKGLEGSRLRERIKIVLEACDLERKISERKIGNLSKGYRQRVGIADALLAEPRLIILDEPTIGLDPHQSAVTRKMMERLRGEVSFLLSSHILSEVEACCDRMIILSHGQIVAEGSLYDLQKRFINKTIFTIVASGSKINIQKEVRMIDSTCELLKDDPVEASGKRRFTFSTLKGDLVAESVIKNLFLQKDLKVSEFQITRPDLQTIFLRATKQNWDEKDISNRTNVKN